VPSTRRIPRSGAAAVDRWRPWVLLLVGLIATAAITYCYSRAIEAEDRERFDRLVGQIRASISHRIQTHVAVLRGAAGLFAGSGLVERDEFRAYVEQLHLAEEYPGIQGVGFSRRLPPAEVSAFVAAQRRAGLREFRVWPDHPRDEYHAITYLEPLDRRNRAALGFDMFTEPARREAMERARDTGQPSASGRVTLVQEIDPEKQAGFLIYVPLYEGGRLPDSEVERHEALLGYVYAPFRVADFLEAVFDGQASSPLDLELFDGPAPDPAHLMHHWRADRPDRPQFSRVQRIDVAGRPWTARFASTVQFDAESKRWLIPVMLGLGLLVSVLIAGLSYLDARARYSARRFTSYREAVRHGDRLHQLAVEQVKDHAIFMVDPEGHVATWSEGVERVLGWGESEFVGQPWDVIYVPEDVANGVPAEERRLAGEREVVAHDRWHQRKDGTRFWGSGTTSRLVNEDGDFAGLLVVMRDLTELRQSTERRRLLLEAERQAREEAERIGRMKDEFLATLSHELRTPLNAILGWSQILSRGGVDAGQAARAFESIERNARTQAKIVEELLDMSRIVSGKVRLEIQPVETAGAIDTAVDVVRPAIQAKGLHVVPSVPPGLPPIDADPNRLQQILWNLLTNAVKFTPPGGRIEIRARQQAGLLEIAVADTGQGIAKDFLPHVFERFRQADASTTRTHGGLGLGLSIVKSLVELHGGTIRASSDGEGLGACFEVALPVSAEAGAPLERPVRFETWAEWAAAPRPLRDVRLSGRHVLVVDDDEDTRELVRTILEECGARVTLASSAAEALDVLGEARSAPDVLLSDIGMPGMDGYELLQRARRLRVPGASTMRAVALTALAGDGDRALAARSGYDRHVAKPVERQELIDAIGTCLVAPR
jgi:PAS domain S-box-containing protein